MTTKWWIRKYTYRGYKRNAEVKQNKRHSFQKTSLRLFPYTGELITFCGVHCCLFALTTGFSRLIIFEI
uniref:Uncharacterized protein n=1 Tax=Kuenenia stuttgartiensis TaxID=174633 RepID=Q1Q5Z7_KUEST|nr:unknown protein [Candidatus Kuenenia stuttgartiensis]